MENPCAISLYNRYCFWQIPQKQLLPFSVNKFLKVRPLKIENVSGICQRRFVSDSAKHFSSKLNQFDQSQTKDVLQKKRENSAVHSNPSISEQHCLCTFNYHCHCNCHCTVADAWFQSKKNYLQNLKDGKAGAQWLPMLQFWKCDGRNDQRTVLWNINFRVCAIFFFIYFFYPEHQQQLFIHILDWVSIKMPFVVGWGGSVNNQQKSVCGENIKYIWQNGTTYIFVKMGKHMFGKMGQRIFGKLGQNIYLAKMGQNIYLPKWDNIYWAKWDNIYLAKCF